jgi:hypothetical protein
MWTTRMINFALLIIVWSSKSKLDRSVPSQYLEKSSYPVVEKQLQSDGYKFKNDTHSEKY